MKIELDDTILSDAINTYGSIAQIDIAIEECAELIDALSKFKRGRVNADAVITEIADVQIVVAELEQMFGGCTKLVEMERMRKMDRLRGRLEAEHRRAKN